MQIQGVSSFVIESVCGVGLGVLLLTGLAACPGDETPTPECNTDAECSEPLTCVENEQSGDGPTCECVVGQRGAECALASDCSAGATCNASCQCEGGRTCDSTVDECVADVDCGANQVCSSCSCTCPASSACQADSDCSTGEICSDCTCIAEGNACEQAYRYFGETCRVEPGQWQLPTCDAGAICLANCALAAPCEVHQGLASPTEVAAYDDCVRVCDPTILMGCQNVAADPGFTCDDLCTFWGTTCAEAGCDGDTTAYFTDGACQTADATLPGAALTCGEAAETGTTSFPFVSCCCNR